eukprot:COSAG06_NODE_62878_length_264_cov_0.363636_1_plen_32_part_10
MGFSVSVSEGRLPIMIKRLADSDAGAKHASFC